MKYFKMVNIEHVIKRVKQLKRLEKQEEVATLLGIKHPDFCNRKGRGTLLKLFIKWASDENVNLDWLFYGRGEASLSQKASGAPVYSYFEDLTGDIKVEEVKTKKECGQKHNQKTPHVISENKVTFQNTGAKMSHADMVGLFKDKAWALKMNEMLLELECIDPHRKEVIKAYLEGMLVILRSKKNTEQI